MPLKRPTKKAITRIGRATHPAQRTEPPVAPILRRIPKTAELIAEHIRKMIIRGELRDGGYLEPQGSLIASYAVSRPTIREAFRILEAEELITVSRGSRTGARIHSPKADVVARQAGLVLQSRGTTLGDVYEARLAIEPWAARIVAARRSSADVERLRGCVRKAYDNLTDSAQLSAAVTGFHEALVEISQNQTLNLLITIVREVIRRHEARMTAATLAASEDRRKSALPGLRSFEKLIALIEAGDAAGAEKHWRLHMENANKHWLQGARASTSIDLLE